MERREDCVVVRPEGDVVASVVAELRANLLAAIGDGAKNVVLDLSAVRIIDSLGISTLIAAHNSLDGCAGKLQLINTNDDLRTLLRLMRLDQHFEIS
jgi:anti-sigma B factor antagonist